MGANFGEENNKMILHYQYPCILVVHAFSVVILVHCVSLIFSVM